ncbi:MAG: hypothetical protein DMG75_11535 [Acidobacteria bacterium]|nr:MAG: hypothetical protein DMG75_11535 [Acidobacteriota bacterium]
MSISTARKISIAARIAAQHASRSRTFSAVMRAGRATGGVFGRILHQLWLEVTGFVFMVLASIGGLALVREYQKYEAGKTGLGRVAIAICFCLTFAYFGLSSFWRVRNKNKSFNHQGHSDS